MKLENLIGDYQAFFSDVLHRSKKAGIEIPLAPLSHLTYRVATLEEYEYLRDEIFKLCSEYVETQFNGRAVAILILQKTLVLENGFTVEMIELPAPRSAHTYSSGLESLGFMIEETLPEFVKQYDGVLTGIKDHGVHCQPAFLTFENKNTAKFYDISLREIVRLQGWEIAKVV